MKARNLKAGDIFLIEDIKFRCYEAANFIKRLGKESLILALKIDFKDFKIYGIDPNTDVRR